MKFTAAVVATAGSVFAPGAFNFVVGSVVMLKSDGSNTAVPARITGATVISSGTAVLLTLETEDMLNVGDQ